MSHLAHLDKNKQKLDLKFAMLKLVREFFWQKKFTEVEAPLILKFPGQEPFLTPMKVTFDNEQKEKFSSYLHTSPEYAMKKMLATGWQRIFCLGKCFRGEESFGGTHNPEFTMIEWYRSGADYCALMKDCENLFRFIATNLRGADRLAAAQARRPWKKFSMRVLWRQFVGVDLNDYLSVPAMRRLCLKKDYVAGKKEPYEDLFYKIFLNEVEPRLAEFAEPVIVYEYPAAMASLSRLSPKDARYAERFEIYWRGMELGNAFSELTEVFEQRKRLKEDQKLRRRLGREVYDLDQEFLSALESGLPKSAGIALGLDRLAMIFANCQNIDDVIALPMSTLFK